MAKNRTRIGAIDRVPSAIAATMSRAAAKVPVVRP